VSIVAVIISKLIRRWRNRETGERKKNP
jgi:hypothetical protein